MSTIKKLASQTAWYGGSTIVGRMLNYLLTPVYTYIFLPEVFGVVSFLYSYMAFANVIYTYGMETSFFYFSEKETDRTKVYNNAVSSIAITSVLFSLIIVLFANPVSEWMHFGQHPEYLYYVAAILAFDAISQLPFALLRKENRPRKFAAVKLTSIIFNVVLNLFFLLLCPKLLQSSNSSLHNFAAAVYNPEFGVGYVFIINVCSSALALILLSKEFFQIKWKIDTALLKAMLLYSLPLLIAGLAGMINETLDRILLNFLVVDPKDALHQQGIYGACYKLSMFMAIFIQAFRFAAEPFFFSRMKNEDNQKTYALVMNYFAMACAFIFVVVMMYLNIFKYFLGKNYWEGLHVVPILLLANLCLGIYINQSIWYKLSGQTRYGAYFSLFGAAITIVLNLILIPRIGYLGAAYTTLICYASMMVLSYFVGQKIYPINYNVKQILGYIFLSLFTYFISYTLQHYFHYSFVIELAVNTILMLAFCGVMWRDVKKIWS